MDPSLLKCLAHVNIVAFPISHWLFIILVLLYRTVQEIATKWFQDLGEMPQRRAKMCQYVQALPSQTHESTRQFSLPNDSHHVIQLDKRGGIRRCSFIWWTCYSADHLSMHCWDIGPFAAAVTGVAFEVALWRQSPRGIQTTWLAEHDITAFTCLVICRRWMVYIRHLVCCQRCAAAWCVLDNSESWLLSMLRFKFKTSRKFVKCSSGPNDNPQPQQYLASQCPTS